MSVFVKEVGALFKII